MTLRSWWRAPISFSDATRRAVARKASSRGARAGSTSTVERSKLSATSRGYVAAVRAHPLMERWYDEAAAEPASWQIEKYENPA